MTRDQAADVVIAEVLRREGGIADIGDGKGTTAFGQTPGWLAAFGFESPTDRAVAAANYRTWLVRTRLIGLCDYPDTLADAVIDYAVHAGHPAAIKALQSALGLAPDGVLGPETQRAIDHCARRKVAASVVAARGRSFGRLITRAPEKHALYAAGWLSRLGEQIEALGRE